MGERYLRRPLIFLVVLFSLTFAPLALFGQEGEPSPVELGDAAFEAGKFDEAVDLYTKRLGETPVGNEIAVVLCKRGRAYLSLKRYGEAVSDLDRAIALAPGSKDAYYFRALARLDVGIYADAGKDADSAVKIDPNISEYHLLLGGLKNIDGNYKGALNDFDTAIGLKGESAAAYCGRGFAFCGLVQYDFAMRDFKRAVKLAPNFAEAYRGMAVVSLSDEAGDGRTALGYAEKAVKIDRNHRNLETLAAALYGAEMIDIAVKVQREAVELLSGKGTPGEKIRFETAYGERLELYEEGSAGGQD
ncbi:MAG: tetratricopeptide repeat protein [Deltaproteobacteria bacterium]|uniref:Tetratricopeptide repeat protein n=1 Tax=Candidatus Zymogenus saltonus TaxID=2844893 RepID=A0A9D8KDC2_9DELT|nr:tetratricopeptide repeat protein [Candidatus Zymogenus saltonus]